MPFEILKKRIYFSISNFKNMHFSLVNARKNHKLMGIKSLIQDKCIFMHVNGNNSDLKNARSMKSILGLFFT